MRIRSTSSHKSIASWPSSSRQRSIEIWSFVWPARKDLVYRNALHKRTSVVCLRSGRRGICRDVPVKCADEGLVPSSSRAFGSRDGGRVWQRDLNEHRLPERGLAPCWCALTSAKKTLRRGSMWLCDRGSGAAIEQNPQAGVRGADALTEDSATPALRSNSSNSRCAGAVSSKVGSEYLF